MLPRQGASTPTLEPMRRTACARVSKTVFVSVSLLCRCTVRYNEASFCVESDSKSTAYRVNSDLYAFYRFGLCLQVMAY